MARVLLGNIKGEKGDTGEMSDYLVSLNDFDGVGDGVTDNTTALLTMLDSEYTNFFIPKGEFLITQPINITRNDITIQAEGTLVFDVSEETGLNISGDNNTISVNVDGKDKIRIGINIDGRNNTVTGCSVSNIYSTSDMACGINSRQNGNTVISGNAITNVTSVGNDVGGDNSGASRGIRITGLSTNDGFTLIKDNSVFNVLGEEGDAIHLNARNQTEMEVVVDNNHIYNFSRRAIKIQASNTRITNNKIENYLDYVGLMRTIDIQSVHKTVVDNNEIIVDYVSCFGVTGTETVEVLDTTITNNKVTLLSRETVFNTSYVNGIDFSNNTLVGGTPMIVNRCKNAVISKNVIKDTLTDDTVYAISNLGSSENVIISDNIIKDSVYKAPLRTSTENVVVTGNTFIGTGRGIEAHVGSGIIANNVVKTTVNDIIDGGTENHQILNNIKLTGV